jgi:hypothetical protein
MGFASLEGEASFSDLPPQPEPIIPFTGTELVQAATWILVFGLRLQTPEEVQAFTEAFQRGIVPMLPPAAVLDYLKVGEALASYGIGKNRLPAMGSVEALPPWLRILLGGVVLALSAYGGARAVQAIRHPSPPPGVGGGDHAQPAQA